MHGHVLHIENQSKLVPTIHHVLANVPRVVNACKCLVQIKDEDWVSKFVDLKKDQMIPHLSMQNVIPQIGFLISKKRLSCSSNSILALSWEAS